MNVRPDTKPWKDFAPSISLPDALWGWTWVEISAEVNMTEASLITILLTAVIGPVLLFSAVALFSSIGVGSTESPENAEEKFLLADRNISPGDFVNSSTGYMIQVSTTFYFIYWGYNYGFSNIFYMLSWASGIMLFSLFARKLFEARISMTSLPSLITQNRWSILRMVAAATSILSFVGVFYVEAFFTADLISGIASNEANLSLTNPAWWAIFSVIVLIVSLYSLLGGLGKVVATDVWQLSLAYLGMGVTFSFLLSRAFDVQPVAAVVLGALCLALFISLLVTDRGLRDGRIKIFSILVSVLAIGGVTAAGAPKLFNANLGGLDIPGPFTQVLEPWGWFTLGGFVVLNVFWQFADSSNFQRIAALRLEDDPDRAEQVLRRSIRKLILVSPLTWGLGIILGMLIRASSIPVTEAGLEYQGLVSLLRDLSLGGDFVATMVLVSLVVALVSIMMSTADSALMAASQAFFKDFGRGIKFSTSISWVFSFFVVFLVFALAMVHRNVGNASVLTVMAGAYSAVIVLAPLSLAALMQRPIHPLVGTVAILTGLAGSLLATFGPIGSLPFNVQLVLNIIVGFSLSLVVTLLGSAIFKRR